ncbi:MAG: T9SS C-terminal target domain-containing protein [Bacteroidetes bacterium]|nr:MAG: T9SS C-terminal target domain-containing protein [Bacteroidota bacterium]
MKNLLTYCTLLFLTANSLFAYNFPPQSIHSVQQVILDSLGIEEVAAEEKVSFVKTTHFLESALKMKSANTLLNDDVLFADDNISVMKVHPNPATVVAFLDYKMSEKIQAKLTIRNLLGKVVDEYSLQRGEHKLKIPTANYDSGVYFYTLSINGRSVKSKKLIVDGR